ncbi:type I DNA topoisomerase [Mycoplasma sp. Pen4]|uniref:type I DNA topoisomerase n=1 Tax=Mycoplasma sp. Pen4 TaxID=640330 RepID=UPI0016549104|nr:type I DNA topoisomerase [Mycoplasma sp. Pen4]QNM93768.1 type I DNA topoisomerase [Mycoplasma sp. Pen4]
MNASKLIIVESPNKVATIKKYVGPDFEVLASVGHILKMKSSGQFGLGIDFENWEPQYAKDASKNEVIKKLKEAVKNADHVYIATDPDREGEAIAEHLVDYLKIKSRYSRIKYNEITKDAILRALNNPIMIDEHLVDAQKSRRMLDRIIGYRLSNLMRSKFSNAPGNATAGRVQSIALKLIVDRENEIRNFIPEDYYTLKAKLPNDDNLAVYFNENNETKKRNWILPNEYEVVKKYFDSCDKELEVANVQVKNIKMPAVTPFKQAALYKRSPLSSTVTQNALQKLYEGYGDGGLISYPRTDSTRLSNHFIEEAQKYIFNKWGNDYVSKEIKGFSGEQDAHEAIRPTDVALTPSDAKVTYPEMSSSEFKIYKLVYENTMQALISQPERRSTQYIYNTGEYKFTNSYSKVIFEGYYVVTGYTDEKVDPGYTQGQKVAVESFDFDKSQTKPKPRYNGGTLIEALDLIKVGRPSTFATTVKTVKDRLFVEPKQKQLKPTEFGEILLNNLIKAFPDIINETYTASVEEQLDLISEDKLDYKQVMQEFWDKFIAEYEKAGDKIEKHTFKLIHLGKPCPECGGDLVIRHNKKNLQKFIACANFPKCKFTDSYIEEPESDEEIENEE